MEKVFYHRGYQGCAPDRIERFVRGKKYAKHECRAVVRSLTDRSQYSFYCVKFKKGGKPCEKTGWINYACIDPALDRNDKSFVEKGRFGHVKNAI